MYKLSLPSGSPMASKGMVIRWFVTRGREFAARELLCEVETEELTMAIRANRPGRIVRFLSSWEDTKGALAVIAQVNEQPGDDEIDSFLADDLQVAKLQAACPVMLRHKTKTSETSEIVDRSRTAAVFGERAPLPLDVAVREVKPLSDIGHTMAMVTARSWAQVPVFTHSLEISAPHWREARDHLRTATGRQLGYNDMVIESTVRALQKVPQVNSSFDGDRIVYWDEINVSIAVASPKGLVVPVVRNAERMDIGERAGAVAHIVERAMLGALHPDDLEGGTVTVSNLGMFGIEGGFPMVTAPQSAIVFVGAIRDRVLTFNGEIVVVPAFSVTCAFDHRALDGATAAEFSMALKEELEGWR